MSDATAPRRPGRLIGVEEEFLVVDPASRHVAPEAATVRARGAADPAGGSPGAGADGAPTGAGVHTGPDGTGIEKELTEYQLEVATPACADLAVLRDALRSGRALLSGAAARAGYAVMPSGTAVLGGSGSPPLADDERYERMRRRFRELLSDQAVCGCHIHLEMPDRQTALAVSNHMRVWLPALQALSANSPYSDGSDTGYASWRMFSVTRWPVSGPPPFWRSVEQYEALVASLVRAGVMLDEGMVYWYLRPSTHVPTLEMRMCDVMPHIDDVLLVAGLARALARLAAADIADGVEAVEVPDEMLRAAHWRASRDGLAGAAVDVLTGRAMAATGLVERLLGRIREVLGADADSAELDELYARMRERGAPAQRQRSTFGRRRDLRDVVDGLLIAAPPDAEAAARLSAAG